MTLKKKIGGKIVLTVFTNVILLLLYADFVRFRYTNFLDLLNNFNQQWSFAIIFKSLGHEIIILLIGLLSLVGILFKRNSKLCFFITILYISISSTTIILAPSVSMIYCLKLLTTLTFLWLIIFENVFSVYQNKMGLKFIFLSLGMIIYSEILYFLGIL